MRIFSVLIKSLTVALIIFGSFESSAQQPCYIPYQEPDCLLRSSDSFAEALKRQELHERQRRTLSKEERTTYSSHNPDLLDLLASNKYGKTLDSLYRVSTSKLADTFGIEYLCDHFELVAGNNFLTRVWREETYKGTFKFKWYKQAKTCYADKFSTIQFEFIIPRRGVATLGTLKEQGGYTRFRTTQRNEFTQALDSNILEALQRLENERAGMYYLFSSNGKTFEGASDRTLPFEESKLEFTEGPSIRTRVNSYTSPFDNAKNQRHRQWDQAVVSATFVGKHTFIDQSNSLRNLLVYDVHQGYAKHNLDSTLFLTIPADHFQGSHSRTMPSLGQHNLLYVYKQASSSGLHRDVPTGFLGDTSQIYNGSIPSTHNVDFSGENHEYYLQNYPEVTLQKYKPYTQPALQQLYANQRQIEPLPKSMLNLNNEQLFVRKGKESELQILQCFDASEPFLHLEQLVIPYKYHVPTFGNKIVEKGVVDILINNYSIENSKVLITHLANNYDVELEDIKPGLFTMTLQRKDSSRATVLPVTTNSRISDLVRPNVVLTIKAQLDTPSVDTLFVVDYENEALIASYSTPDTGAQPFEAIIDNVQLLHPNRTGKNYYVSEDRQPLIERISPLSVSPGDTLTITGQRLGKEKDVSFTGSTIIDGYTYYRFFKASSKNIVESSATQWKVIVPTQGTAIHRDHIKVNLSDGLIKVGYTTFSPMGITVKTD